ncbi:MAG TPA: DUF4331 domain-containing protein [Bryobacteraceae bacterium]|nr:DUF4331 domain-containing protein [Bryobacteraceae bacterium]
MRKHKSIAAFVVPLLMLAPAGVFASSHREAPITALDHSADVTDWYAFVSYDNPNNVTFILNVDPLLEPANGPNYFPFDPSVLYQMLIDNNQDGKPDVVFQFRFTTDIRLPKLYTGFIGGGLAGIPSITSLSGPGSDGLSLRQTYTVTMVKNGVSSCLNCGQTLYAVPSNVGPATMPNYPALFNQGIYSLGNGIKVWAGTADDPFFIDLGAAFDSLNFRSGIGPVLPPSIDADDTHNYAPDAVGGYNVNSIVLEVPITMLTVDGQMHSAGEKQAVIGTYGSTSRAGMTVRRSPNPDENSGAFQQVNREGNPLINELIIGTGSKDRFSMDLPVNDSQFANFVLEPVLASVFSSAGIPVAPNPRTDLLILAQYEAPICPGCGPSDAGPVADLLRLNTGIPPTPVGSQKRLGFLAGDTAGYPNGRRPVDDVFDISARAVEGILVSSSSYGLALGDGVQTKTEGFNNSFPYVMPANNGRDSAHIGPGQAGCTGQPGGICPVQ